MTIDHACQTGRHPITDRGHDVYETPEVAVRALLRVELLPESIWEPACGSGNIAAVLRSRGHHVYASDLVDHGCPDSKSGVDFLTIRRPPPLDAIVTNPPYKLAGEFVTHALITLQIPKVVMLLRLAFLESERRRAILDSGQLARVYVFRNRLPMMHRKGWDGPKATSAMPFAWFVWERNYLGPTELQRISWDD